MEYYQKPSLLEKLLKILVIGIIIYAFAPVIQQVLPGLVVPVSDSPSGDPVVIHDTVTGVTFVYDLETVNLGSSQSIPKIDNSTMPTANLLPLETMISQLKKNGINNIDWNRVRTHYQEIIDKSNTSGYNPAFTMAIWLEESGASNYALYPTVADFGCISLDRTNFEVQLSCWLRLWNSYSTQDNFAVCRGPDNTLSLREFLLIYEGGYKSCQANSFVIEPQFPGRLEKYYQVITGTPLILH